MVLHSGYICVFLLPSVHFHDDRTVQLADVCLMIFESQTLDKHRHIWQRGIRNMIDDSKMHHLLYGLRVLHMDDQSNL